MTKSLQFHVSDSKIKIHLPDKRVLTGQRGASLQAFLQPLTEEGGAQIVGAVINGKLEELTTAVENESVVIPTRMDSSDGMRIYRRSLTFLLESAFGELFPDGEVNIVHSVSSGGYYCQVKGREALNEEQLGQVKARMTEIKRWCHMRKQSLILSKRTRTISHFYLNTARKIIWFSIIWEITATTTRVIWCHQRGI
jgi:uridine kinase